MHLVCVDMIEIANSILIIETNFYMIQKRVNVALFADETLGSLFKWLDKRNTYTNSIINDFFFEQKRNCI